MLGDLTMRANDLQDAIDSVRMQFGPDDNPRKRIKSARQGLAADVARVARERGMSVESEEILLVQLNLRAWARANRGLDIST